MDIGGPEILIVILVVLVLFGGAKLPKLARSLGSAKGEFEKGLKEGAQASKEATPAEKPAEVKAVEAPAAEPVAPAAPVEPVVDTTATLAEDKPANNA
jgi:sec-independent protein translocase protein TatA